MAAYKREVMASRKARALNSNAKVSFCTHTRASMDDRCHGGVVAKYCIVGNLSGILHGHGG